MSLAYPGQQEIIALGTVVPGAIEGDPSTVEAVILTNSYNDTVSDMLHVEHYAQLTFCVEYITSADGAGSSVEIKVEGSPDRLDNDSVVPLFYQETASLTSGGTITHTAAEHEFVGASNTTSYKFFFYAPPAFMTIKVSAKETAAGVEPGSIIVRLITSGK